jgi:tetratricopeptide (TPR) repeat protein
MKRYGWLAALVLFAFSPAFVAAQSDSSQGGASNLGQAQQSLKGAHMGAVHGKANNPVGQPIADANVFATTDGSPKSAVATFVTDANGEYKGAVPDGKYIFVLQDKAQKNTEKEIDNSELTSVVEKDDVTVNFDGSREAYMKKLAPAERKKIEETMAKNSAINAENSKIKNLNAILAQERDARKAGNVDEATKLATEITVGKPEEGIGWYELGKDQVMQKQYDQAVPNLEKAVQLNATGKKPDPEVTGAAEAALGDAYAHTKKLDQAAQAFDAAGKADPTNAYTYYSNEAILLSDFGNIDQAAAAADKAIALDPNKPMAYYLKGRALVQKAGTDSSGKVTVPPGCVEAYQKYLELDPSGAHAQEVQELLQGIGVKVKSSYKAKK